MTKPRLAFFVVRLSLLLLLSAFICGGGNQALAQIKKDAPAKISLNHRDAELRTVLEDIAAQIGKKLISNDSISGRVTLELTDVPWEQAVNQALAQAGQSNVKAFAFGDELYVLPVAAQSQSSTSNDHKQIGNTEVYRSIERIDVITP